MVDRSHYNCVLSQQFSPCGNYLVCGNSYGDIVVFNVSDSLNDEKRPAKGPEHSFTTPNLEQVCSMASTDQFLITGTVEVIYGWDWTSVIDGCPKVAWKILLSAQTEKKVFQDVNSLFVRKEEHMNYLYAGCGDNVIHVHSLEDGKFIRSFEGHTNYIHSICHFDGQMGSCSEDGSVRLWDLRQLSMTARIEPSSDPKLARPHLGKWVGDIDLSSQQLVCGGGSRGAVWDLRTLEVVTTFEGTEDGGLHITKFMEDDSVLLAGNLDYVYRLKTDGEELSKIESSSSTVYSAIFRDEPHKVLSLAGSSQHIDLSTDYSTRFQVLSFF